MDLLKCAVESPLILELMGYKLREEVSDVSTYKDVFASLKETLTRGEEDKCRSVVDVVYNSLKEPRLKEAFLDIACFFNSWPWRIVSYVVGMENLKALERAGLVQVCRESDLR
ncbi:hypothetical protein SUGI_0854430 [Cryptomeria japonica]|nr:hypothetical protein SUGI_0854430 [Cryptomeria japonica]